MPYSDAGHRAHADYKGERPVANEMSRGPESIRVSLDTWGPQDNLFLTMYDELQANWGAAPSRTRNRRKQLILDEATFRDAMADRTGWALLHDDERAYIEKCFKGETLPQVMEGISFHFTIDGVDRAMTHQLVRTRQGAAFMQHGGRDNDWRHRKFAMPETVYRAVQHTDGHPVRHPHCVTDPEPLQWIQKYYKEHSLADVIDFYLTMGRNLYGALVDAGVPWQDARSLLWTGQETYIHGLYNYLALKGLLGKRLEPVMGWQINCVAQLMKREVNMKCPEVMSRYLGSTSELVGIDVLSGLESWTPPGRFHSPHKKEGKDTLPRRHTPEQNPFWVLHPDSMGGNPVIGWVATDGRWPVEWPSRPQECDIVI
jgi:thymidylate synthase ThyX